MATASVTYTFSAGASASAAQVNTNFADLVSFLNGSVVHKDGAVAMTGRLTLASLVPTAADHAVRKSYLDKFQIKSATVATLQTRNNGAYGDLATVGPAVTVTVPGTEVFIELHARVKSASGTDNGIAMAVAVSGATTIAAADANGENINVTADGLVASLSRTFKLTGLNAGSNTFTAKYLASNTSSFEYRDITVWTVA